TREVMQFAWQLKAPLVTLRIGRIPAADSEQYRLLVEVLNDLARHGNHVGAVLAVTPTRDDAESLTRLMREITQGPVGIDFDPAGFAMNGADAVAAYRELHELVTNVLIRDGLRDVDGSGREVPVGRGEVDWTELIPMIDQSRYRGPLTVLRTAGDDRAGDCARAIQFLRRLRLG
ncbi:MAG: sugar phosphate isomerase/epimerase family protein, partial [Planctomycetaceae bacterium]